ncbi:MarR family transcriptional regulator [Leptolyngbya sp. CCY15150]|uniref:MarR family transcriptional regulator n=1 Tax=Leptolyngbya sp. CCY15150 TaxID=2767772 RepID=UPI001952206C|nr:MarR family transcriptional regulator [Leptolyngbya sp. CCY15150]
MSYSKTDKDNFFAAVNSLKKYRRAEITDEAGKDLVETLYTDLLPNEQILKACLTDNTTFLIGRKGTGKSTIFLKLQREYRKKSNILSCYIDAKTVFESSQTDFINIEHLDGTISDDALSKYILERNFIQSILRSLLEEIKKKSDSFLEKIKQALGIGGVRNVTEKLKKLNEIIDNNDHLKLIEVPSLQQISISRKLSAEKANEIASSKDSRLMGTASPTDLGIDASSSISRTTKDSRKNLSELEEQFSDVFLKVFQIKNFINQLKDILSLLEIRSLVILLDDFSEIPDHSMRVFVDVILAPLNNWSEEFIKFKVAAYPNRVYFGKIDQGKIDKISLDFYDLYSTRVNKSVMEEKSIDFTRRLIERRVEHFTNQPVEYFFDTRKEGIEEYYGCIFQVSMNVPRIIGYILYYCYESKVAYGNPITKASLEDAAEKYYELTIEPFFHNTTYSLKSFEEKISILQLRELLLIFVEELKTIQSKIRTNELSGVIYEVVRTNPYTSHFIFNPIHEQFLKTLELNFFVSKYNEMSGRDRGKQSVYCLNYGLCVKYRLRWGYPKGAEHRKYLISRPFDFNNIIESFLRTSKRIICINPECNRNFPFDQLQFLEFTNMKCPDCQNPVRVVANSETIEAELSRVDNAKLLPDVELGILYEIHKSENSPKPKEIAEELDCSHQLVGWRAKKLDEVRGLISRESETGQRVYKLTDKAKEDYFPESD